MKTIDEMAINLKFSGYSDKLFNFAEIFIEIMLECARKEGFESDQVMNSIEKTKATFANSNIEVSSHAEHNRKLFIMPHLFHDLLIEKELNQ